ncbi:MAG TPA: RDD family protein [Bacteroidia bacterium]|nr:RDD family protein [Bacteroidia bacterium]
MDNIKINTTQNVALDYQAAGLGPRILAVILDTIFRLTYFFLLLTIFYQAFERTIYSNKYLYNDEASNQLMYAILIICELPAILYHLLCETFLNGQSFGKKIVKIKVVKLDGTQPNFGSYLIRSMFRLLDDGIVGLIVIAVSKNSQRVGDMVAGTTVIVLNKKMTINDTILSRNTTDYKIVYNQVSLLSDKDANTINEVLLFAGAQQQSGHLKLLAQKIKQKYGIQDVKQDDEAFLRTILEDYSHYQFEN